MGKDISLTIDGREIKGREGDNLLQTARDAGVNIPGLCYHPRLSTTASCRLCVVKLNGTDAPTPACTTRITDGLEVVAFDEELEAWRRQLIDLLFSQHDCNCINCDMAGDCDLQELANRYGLIGLNNQEFRQAYRDANRKYERFPGARYSSRETAGAHTGEAADCIRCSHCVETCKMNLYPVLIMEAEEMGDLNLLRRLYPEDCINCELCSYVCPSQIGLSEYVQRAKRMKAELLAVT